MYRICYAIRHLKITLKRASSKERSIVVIPLLFPTRYFKGARGVVNKKSITLDKAKLKVKLKQPVKELPIDTRRLMVKGLSEKTTSDGLRDYMEVVSGVDVLAVEFGEQGRALVTFNETYGKLKSICI